MNKKFYISIISITFLLVMWQILSNIITTGELIEIPDSIQLINGILEKYKSRDFYFSLANTLITIIFSLGSSLIIGLFLSTISYYNEYIRSIIEPIIIILLTIPAICWVFIVIIIFGISLGSSIIAISLIVVPLIYKTFQVSFSLISDELNCVFKIYKSKKQRAFKLLYWPSLKNGIIIAIQLGFSLCWKVTVVAEAIGFGSGIGYQIGNSFSRADLPGVMTWTFSFTILVMIINWSLSFLLYEEKS